MLHYAPSVRALALAAILLAAMSGFASAADDEDDNTRAVRVIESPEAPAATAPASPPAVAPQQPAAIVPQPVIAPAPAPAAAVPEPASKPQQLSVPRKQAALGKIEIDAKSGNPAELSLDLLPGLDVAVGARVSFRVTAKKSGYVILVDVDAEGKLSQIYPVPNNVVGGRPSRPNANYIAAGKSLQIPNAGDNFSGVEYVASPPSGVAMIVAILSDRPVQILDLPDIPAALTGQTEALAFLTKFAKELRIPQANGGRLQEARWSFDAKFYAIR